MASCPWQGVDFCGGRPVPPWDCGDTLPLLGRVQGQGQGFRVWRIVIMFLGTGTDTRPEPSRYLRLAEFCEPLQGGDVFDRA